MFLQSSGKMKKKVEDYPENYKITALRAAIIEGKIPLDNPENLSIAKKALYKLVQEREEWVKVNC